MATRSLGQLTIDLIAKIAGFEQGMDRAARTADKQFRRMEARAVAFGTVVGNIASKGLDLLGRGLLAIAHNTIKSEQELAQLEAILKSTGNAAGYSRDQLVGMAGELQKASTFASGEIIEAQTRLLSYSGIVGENIPRAMQAVIDQSARLGMSLSQSAETIGRALESPAKAAAALAQQGFGAAFTKEVRATIDALVAAGREADAQILILEILEESYGGAAQAARDTLGGALSALKNTIADILTGDDGSFSGLTDAVNDLNAALSDPGFKKATSAIAQAFTDFATSAARSIKPLVAEIKGVGTALEGLAGQASASWSIISGAFTLSLDGMRKGLDDYRAASDKVGRGFGAAFAGYRPNQFDNVRSSVGSTYDAPATVDTSGLVLRDSKAEAAARAAAAKAAREQAAALRELERAQEEAARRARDFTEAQDDARRSIEDIRSEVEGPTAQVMLRYSRMEHELDLQMAEGVITLTQYAEAMELVHQSREKALDGLVEKTKEVEDAMTVFADEAARNMQTAFADFLFDPFEEGLSGMVKGFSDALRRMAAEFAASQFMDLIFGNKNTGQGGLLDLFMSSGWGYASGGYTGPGGKYEPAGVVHKGEVVWSQSDVARAGGVGIVEAMRRGLAGYANGGSVGSFSPVGPQLNVTIVKGADEDRVSGPTANSRGGFDLKVFVKTMVNEGFGDGSFDGAMSLYGMRRQGAR